MLSRAEGCNFAKNKLNMFDQMEEQQKAIQKELAAAVIEVTSGDGLVKVKVSGNRELRSITLDRDHADFADTEMLEDHIVFAINDAMDQAAQLEQKTVQEWMSKLLPGGMGGLKGLFS